MNKKTILLLTSDYLPMADANGVCVSKIAEKLLENGHDVNVFCYKGKKDSEFQVINGVKINRVKTPGFRSFIGSGTPSELESNSKLAVLIRNLLYKLRILIYLPLFPIQSLFFLIKYYFSVRKICDSKNIDVVLSSFNPIEAVLSGVMLKRKNKNIKFVSYFLDTLSFIPKKSRISFIDTYIDFIGKKWESYIFKYSDKIILMKSHKNKYIETTNYKINKDKICFSDIPLINEDSIVSNLKKGQNKEKINLLYAGNFYPGMREPNYLCEMISKSQNNVSINFFTKGCERTLRDYKKKFPEVFSLSGYVDHETLKLEISKSNILVSVGNKNTTMVPSKIFEYISTGKPIIHFYYDNYDSSLEYLRKYPFSTLIKVEDTARNNNLAKFESALVSLKGNKVESFDLKELYYENTAEFTTKCIESIFS